MAAVRHPAGGATSPPPNSAASCGPAAPGLNELLERPRRTELGVEAQDEVAAQESLLATPLAGQIQRLLEGGQNALLHIGSEGRISGIAHWARKLVRMLAKAAARDNAAVETTAAAGGNGTIGALRARGSRGAPRAPARTGFSCR